MAKKLVQSDTSETCPQNFARPKKGSIDAEAAPKSSSRTVGHLVGATTPATRHVPPRTQHHTVPGMWRMFGARLCAGAPAAGGQQCGGANRHDFVQLRLRGHRAVVGEREARRRLREALAVGRARGGDELLRGHRPRRRGLRSPRGALPGRPTVAADVPPAPAGCGRSRASPDRPKAPRRPLRAN